MSDQSASSARTLSDSIKRLDLDSSRDDTISLFFSCDVIRNIMRVIDVSASQGHIVPTAFTFFNGAFYVGNLSTFPVEPGASKILKINVGGKIKSIGAGLTTVVGVAFDAQGRMYALETDTVPGFPGPAAAGSGQVVRIEDDGTLTTVASCLVFPTGMTFGPNGALYVSNFGFGLPPGFGQIVRIIVP